jgi:hypothetical protein
MPVRTKPISIIHTKRLTLMPYRQGKARSNQVQLPLAGKPSDEGQGQ